jgi:ribosome maturation factor RimP
MIPDEQISSTVEKEVELLGYELLKLDLISRGRRRVLRIFIDRSEGNVSVDDCVRVSKAVGFVLEGEDLIKGPYNLEVSSPGSNRPLVKPEHFERFAGHGARVEYSGKAGEKRTVIGEIRRIEDRAVVILSEGEELALGFDSIVKANLHGEKWEAGGSKGRDRKRTGKSRKRKRL